MDQVKVGLIGCGQRGKGLLNEILNTEKMQLVGVADVDEARMKAAAERAGVEGYADHQALLARDDLQAVLIATHTRHHAPVITDALDAGKHVLTEKPMVDTGENARAVVAKLEATGLRGMVAYQRRFAGQAEIVRQKTQEIEALQMLVACQRGMMAPQYFFPEHYGGVIDTISHSFDVVNWALGGRPVRACATIRRNVFRRKDAIEFVSALVEYDTPAGACTADFFASLAGVNCPNFIQAIGPKGTFHVAGGKMTVTRHEGFREDKTPINEQREELEAPEKGGPAVKLMLSHFARCVLEPDADLYPGCSFKEGLAAVCVSEAIAESAERGTPVEIEL